MLEIRGTTIKFTRGDTLLTHIGMKVKETGEPYIPVEGDSLRFALKNTRMKSDKSDYFDEEPVILKDIPIETCVLRLEPEDTKSLPCKTYVYDIQLTRADTVVDTFITNATFILDYEVD